MGGQLLNQQPQTGSLSALGGGINQGYDWTSGTPDPNQPIYHAGSDLEMRQPGWNQGPPQNSPQPVPGQPPRPFDPSQGGGQSTWDWRGVQDPRFGPGGVWDPGGNRGSGQPINQPVGGYQAPGMATWTPAPGVPNGWQQGGIENPYGSAGQQPTGSLQSLGGGQLNQSGMVTLRAPDGSQTKAVPADQVAHWLSRGAVRV
jgi:hypothetical protein